MFLSNFIRNKGESPSRFRKMSRLAQLDGRSNQCCGIASDGLDERRIEEEATQRQVGDEQADVVGGPIGHVVASDWRSKPVLNCLVVGEDRKSAQGRVDFTEIAGLDSLVNDLFDELDQPATVGPVVSEKVAFVGGQTMYFVDVKRKLAECCSVVSDKGMQTSRRIVEHLANLRSDGQGNPVDVVDDALEDLVFVGKVVVDRRDAETNLVGDLGHGCGGYSLAGKEPGCCANDRKVDRPGIAPRGLAWSSGPALSRSRSFGIASRSHTCNVPTSAAAALVGMTALLSDVAATFNVVPDWTYLPLKNPAAGVLGSHAKAQKSGLRVITTVAKLPFGDRIIRSFDYTYDHPETAVQTASGDFASPIGVVVSNESDASTTAFRSMGFGFANESDSLPAEAQHSNATTVAGLIQELDDGATLLIANEATISQGPATAQRVNEALVERHHAHNAIEPVQWLKPWTWPAWVWALWLGIAMVCGGIGATVIALGPVLLGYDEEFLGVGVDGLRAMNDQLVPFIQHDRITMAGCMMAIGCNDIGFALAMRRGWRWARAGFLFAGAIGFPTFFLFLGYRFFDPLHFAVAVGFFPLYLGGVFGRKVAPTWRAPAEVDAAVRRKALDAQLMMVLLSAGVFISGFYIMSIGLRDVLIPSDLVFLGGEQEVFSSALDGRLLRFIAHDRAGFGGALASLGAGLLTTSLWGWRAGERSTWWLLLVASVTGFGAALVIHLVVGYRDVLHLAPVYVGIVWVGRVLWLSNDWFRTPAD